MDSVYLLRKIIYSRQNWHILLKLSKTLLELHCLHNYKACWLVDFQVTRGQSTTALTRQFGGGGVGGCQIVGKEHRSSILHKKLKIINIPWRR